MRAATTRFAWLGWLVLLGTLGLAGPAHAATTGSVTMVSQSGDYIGRGADRLFEAPAAASMSGNISAVDVETSGSSGAGSGYTLEFGAAPGRQLAPGEYPDATRYPFDASPFPGLDVSGDGSGCNEDVGRFVVKDIHADSSGAVDRFWALYEQHCDMGSAPALYGEVRLGEPAGTTSERVEPAAIDWPDTALNTTGDYVPVTVVAGQASAEIASAVLTGPDAADFTLGNDGCTGESVSPGASCQISVAIAPRHENDLSADLVITDVLGGVNDIPLALLAEPTVSSVSPTGGIGAGGTAVTITGDELGQVNAVEFGTVPAQSFVVNSPTQITAISPAQSPGTQIDVTVHNSHGSSPAVSADRFTYAVPPDPATDVSAVAGTGQATVRFTPSASDGGMPISGYTITSSPGGVVAQTSSSPVTVTGLDEGVTYRFTVTASTAAGDSTPAVSNDVTTRRPSSVTAAVPAQTIYGTPIDLEALVSSAFPGTPTGNVEFDTAGSVVGWGLLGTDGRTSGRTAVVLDVGTGVTLSYSGDSAFEPSTASVQLPIRPAATAMSLSSSANPAAPDSEVTVTATVVNASTSVTPVGNVLFAVDGKQINGGQFLDSAGRASIRIRFPDGAHLVTAYYHDDSHALADFFDGRAQLTESFGTPTYAGGASTSSAVSHASRPPATVTAAHEVNGDAVLVSVRTAAPGTIRYQARTTIARHAVIYASGTVTSTGRRAVAVIAVPTARVRAALARRQHLRVQMTLTFRATGGTHATIVRRWVTLVSSHARRG